jgi:hypothetical protein
MSEAEPSPTSEEALRLVERLPAVLAAIVEAVPAAWLEQRTSSGASSGTEPEAIPDSGSGMDASPGAEAPWGPRAVVEHLLDVEDVAFVQRIRRVAEEDDPFIRSLDPTARLEAGGYRERSLAEVLGELRKRRAADVAWVRTLSPEQLDRPGTHDTAGTITGRQLVHYWATHDLTHLAQLVAALRANLLPHIGSMTSFLEEE